MIKSAKLTNCVDMGGNRRMLFLDNRFKNLQAAGCIM
jgi:hypothetical protein